MFFYFRVKNSYPDIGFGFTLTGGKSDYFKSGGIVLQEIRLKVSFQRRGYAIPFKKRTKKNLPWKQYHFNKKENLMWI